MASELTWKKAIQKVLADSTDPMRSNEIADEIVARKLRTNIGATPSATVGAQVYTSIKKLGKKSPFQQVAKGTFCLRQSPDDSNAVTQPATSKEPSAVEEQYDIVTSFAMFWRRDAIEWTSTPKIMGMQQLGATPVDFNKQLGIYLLYDGREVIYVGRSTHRPLGKRLYEHTSDRLSTRWDRFSWFGLLPVSEVGELGELPVTFDATKMIPALEAILVEALEPRQNRKRGDDLSSVEYIQSEDPAIHNKKVKETLATALSKL